MARILLTDFPWPDTSIESELVTAAGHELVVAADDSPETLIDLAGDCQAILTCWGQVTADVIAAAPRCKIVSRMGIGLDNIDLDSCRARRIVVTNVPDYCVQEVAEHTLGLIFALARNIAVFHHETKRGIYDLAAAPPLRQLHQATLGLIGLGRIGRRVAELAGSLGMRIKIARRPSLENAQLPPHCALCSLEELRSSSDYISLHLPLTAQTRNLVDRTFLAQMKPTSCLINTARGGLIDHMALAEALESDRLAAAALDVQDPEPPDLSQPPYSLPQTIVTPHAAFVSETSVQTLRETAVRQVLQMLAGEMPANVVV